MRFISMHKATREMEAGLPPSPGLLAGIGPLVAEMMQAGVFVAGEGLRPSVHGVRVRFRGGERTITPGPLAGTNQVLDRYLIVRVRAIEDAIDWAERFAGGADAELDVRQVNEPWDVGFAPKPPNLTTTRYMILGASGDTRTAEDRIVPDGEVVLASEVLLPGAQGVRLHCRRGACSVTDGPFTESKELIAGFAIVDVPSRDEALYWAGRFAALFDELEMDVRPLR